MAGDDVTRGSVWVYPKPKKDAEVCDHCGREFRYHNPCPEGAVAKPGEWLYACPEVIDAAMVDPSSPLEVAAINWHQHYVAFRGAGFTEMQALFLVLGFFRNWNGEFNS